jgi:hypothetical protein
MWSAEALLHQARQTPDVVEMRVGEDHPPHGGGIEPRGGPVALAQGLVALEHPAVDHQLFVARLDEVLRPGHGLRGPQEADLGHSGRLRPAGAPVTPSRPWTKLFAGWT